MKKKIVTFGELLLRFSKPHHLRLTQGDMFTSKYGGSEANVAVSLATQGEDVTYITRLPDTPVGHAGAMNDEPGAVGCKYQSGALWWPAHWYLLFRACRWHAGA